MGCALARLGQFLMRVKIEGAAPSKGRNTVAPKLHLNGSFLTTNPQKLVDQSSPDLFHSTQDELFSINICFLILDIWSGFRGSRSKSEVVYKKAQLTQGLRATAP